MIDNFSKLPARNLLSWRWILFFFAMSFSFWGARPLLDSTEARYGEAARGMIAYGSWYIPQVEGHPHLTKPVITYWLIGAGLKLLGNNAWGARLGHCFALFATMLLVAHLARAMGLADEEARTAALVYATGVYPMVAGHSLSTDLPLLCFVLLGTLAFWKVFRGDPRAELWRAVFWFAFAMAFLTKGPPGWLPLLPMVAFSFLHRGRRVGPKLFLHPSTFLYLPLFLALSASWYLVLIAKHPELANYFFKDEFIDRIATTRHKRSEPIWEYPALLLCGLAPWIFCWPELLRRARAKWREGVASLQLWQSYCVLWIALVLPVFMASKSKLPLYINGLFVPLCTGFAVVLVRHWKPKLLATSPAWQRGFTVGLAVWAALLCGISVAENPFAAPRHHRELARELVRLAPTLPPETKYYFVEGQAEYSLSFYSGIPIPEARLPNKMHVEESHFAAFHRDQIAAGVFPVYATKTKRLEKFVRESGIKLQPTILLQDHELSIYCFQPPKGS